MTEQSSLDDQSTALVGPWVSGPLTRIGMRGTISHAYFPDGTLTSNFDAVDETGCRRVGFSVGSYSATGDALTIAMKSGQMAVSGSSGTTQEESVHEFTSTELAATSMTSAPYSIEDDVLTIFAGEKSFTHHRIKAPL